jgi:uncharacterized OB-fold protein
VARQQKMLERTCKKCGHAWVIPKNLKNAGQMGALGGLMSGNYIAGHMAAKKGLALDTCPNCGSVRHFREQAFKA